MSRGIKVYTVPDDFSTLDSITSTGNPQYRDIAIVKPTSYDSVVAIYQYQYNVNNILVPVSIKNAQYTFTDNIIIPNVTSARKAHHDDYRSILNSLFDTCANKYGDFFSGAQDFSKAKLLFKSLTSSNSLYLSTVSDTLNLDYSNEIHVNKVDQIYNFIQTALRLTQSEFDIYLQTNIVGNTSVDGTLTIKKSGQTDTTTITNSSVETVDIGATNIIGTNLTAQNATIVSANIGSALTQNVVTNLNADLLDGWHLQSILDEIPNMQYDPTRSFTINQYTTVYEGSPTKTYGTPLNLGKVMTVDIMNKYTGQMGEYYIPASDNPTLEFCTCTCTCTCQCPCTCTAPCGPCTNTGMAC